MLKKFFSRDKNYVLEQVQLSLEQSLLHYMVDFVKVAYLLRHNPLGIEDEMTKRIHAHTNHNYQHLHNFYFILMGIFRYQHYSDNQLTFIFDGRDQVAYYEEEWSMAFKKFVKEFCKHHNFLRAVLDLTVFYPIDSPVIMVDNRMNNFLIDYFGVKIHPQKGIISKKAS